MVIGKKYIFVQLHKCACTHIQHLLKEFCNGNKKNHHKHAPLKYRTDKIVFGSIRNPWDWYVSL